MTRVEVFQLEMRERELVKAIKEISSKANRTKKNRSPKIAMAHNLRYQELKRELNEVREILYKLR